MDTKRINSFLAIMKYHNLTDASDASFVSESAISKHIVSLENEFGIQLFVRKTHGYYPTKAAWIFNEYATGYVRSYQHVVNELNQLRSIQNNILTIAITSIMCEYRVMECGFCFMAKHPEIKLNMIEAEADDISGLLLEEKTNAAFVSRSVLDPKLFDMLEICGDTFSVVLPASHPLADRREISIEELKDERFIVTGTRSSQYHLFMNLCRRSGFTPNVVHSTERFDALMNMIGYGFGVSLLMTQLALKHGCSQVKVIPLTQRVHDSIVLVRLKNATYTESVQQLWDYMEKCIRNYHGSGLKDTTLK
jgi:LysR family transcriptional activator of glutamate synthase operon